MLSIHEELLKLIPVDTSAKAGVVVERPTDLMEQWRQMAASVAEIAASQRRTVEHLEGFLESVRSAAAETQRTAASSRAHLEDQRATIERDRADLRALLEKVSASISPAAADSERADTLIEEMRAALAAPIDEIRSSVASQLETAAQSLVIGLREERSETLRLVTEARNSMVAQVGPELRGSMEPLASAAVDFRELAVALGERLAELDTLKTTLRSDANAVRAAVSEELLHRHQEMEKLQSAGQDSASAAARQLTSAVDGIREALANHVEVITRDDRRLADFITETRKQAETETRTRIEAETQARLAADEETRARAEAESQARAQMEAAARLREAAEASAIAQADRAAAQLQSTSTSMMAFLEALDDALSLPALEADPASRKSLGRLTSRAARVLEAAGLTEIQAKGQAVDEELHEIVQEISASPELPAGRVVKVVQRGFRTAERVLRRAQVVVAR